MLDSGRGKATTAGEGCPVEVMDRPSQDDHTKMESGAGRRGPRLTLHSCTCSSLVAISRNSHSESQRQRSEEPAAAAATAAITEVKVQMGEGRVQDLQTQQSYRDPLYTHSVKNKGTDSMVTAPKSHRQERQSSSEQALECREPRLNLCPDRVSDLNGYLVPVKWA